MQQLPLTPVSNNTGLDPMAHSVSLLLTRPRAASERFAKQLEEAFGSLKIEISPLIEIECLVLAHKPTEQTIVFTSRNGVEAWANAGFSVDHRCFCVGEATANAARALGFDPFISGGTVQHLVADLQNASPKGGIVHVHGQHTRGDLAQRLWAKGFRARGLVAYNQTLQDLTSSAKTLLLGGGPVIVPLFSPRSAEHFANIGSFGSQVKTIAISKAAAMACPGAEIAPHPNADGMISAISKALNA